MSLLTRNQWFRRFGFGAVAALSLCALMPTGSAQAHEARFRPPVVTHHVNYRPLYHFGWSHGPYWHHWRHHGH